MFESKCVADHVDQKLSDGRVDRVLIYYWPIRGTSHFGKVLGPRDCRDRGVCITGSLSIYISVCDEQIDIFNWFDSRGPDDALDHKLGPELPFDSTGRSSTRPNRRLAERDFDRGACPLKRPSDVTGSSMTTRWIIGCSVG